MRRVLTAARSFAVALCAIAPVHAQELEASAQAVAGLVSDDQTRGGGVGLALELGAPVLRLSSPPRSALVLRLRAGALAGAGVVWTAEAGAAYRARVERWEPDAGLYVLTAGGALARTIDTSGRLAGNPVAIELGLSPLRFRLDQGWVSFLSVRAGPTLARSGQPPLALFITLLEVGRVY